MLCWYQTTNNTSQIALCKMRTRLPRTDYDMLAIHSDLSQKLFSLVGMDIWPDPHPSLARRFRPTTESRAKQSVWFDWAGPFEKLCSYFSGACADMTSFDAPIPNMTMTICFSHFYDRPGGLKFWKLRKFIFMDFCILYWVSALLWVDIYQIHRHYIHS